MATLDDLLDIPEDDRVLSHQARRIIKKFGNEGILADLLSAYTGKPVSRSTIYRWTWPRSRGGTGGFVPSQKMRLLARIARQEGILLTPNDVSVGKDDY